MRTRVRPAALLARGAAGRPPLVTGRRPMARRDRVFLEEARRLHDSLTVVNGLDASGFNERLVQNLREGGVDVDVVGFPNRRFIEQRPTELVLGTTVRALEE